MSESATPESGALSVEQAIAVLEAPEPVEQQAPEAPAEAADEPLEPQGETSAPEVAEDGAETPAEDAEAEAEPEAVAPAEPPKYWSQDAKAKFAELPPELQAVVLQQEGPREEATAKAKAEAAAEVQAARQQAQGVQTLAQQLEGFLPEAVETFKSRWGEPDWEATIRQYGAEEAAVLRARYDKEQTQLQQLATKTQEARQQAHQAYMVEQFQVLTKLDPELAPDAKDPSKGAEKRQEVSKYLLDQGVAPGAIAQISASELIMARKAMLWDQAQTKAKAAPKTPAKPVQVTKPLARGGAAPGAADPTAKATQAAKRSFAQTRSIDGAVAYLESLKG